MRRIFAEWALSKNPLIIQKNQPVQKIKPKILMSLAIAILVTTASFSFTGDNTEFCYTEATPSTTAVTQPIKLFNALNLGLTGVSEAAFDCAIKGWEKLKAAGEIRNDSVISIIDFTKTSDQKRLFVINLHTGRLLFNTWVSHGRNSGLSKAALFSNEQSSYKSSLGFYVTENTYQGKHGYSLRLKGEEAGINDRAEERGIVMHAADYVNESFIKSRGYIGRSEGCPAIPQQIHQQLISQIKNGSCLFIYSDNTSYLSQSQLLN